MKTIFTTWLLLLATIAFCQTTPKPLSEIPAYEVAYNMIGAHRNIIIKFLNQTEDKRYKAQEDENGTLMVSKDGHVNYLYFLPVGSPGEGYCHKMHVEVTKAEFDQIQAALKADVDNIKTKKANPDLNAYFVYDKKMVLIMDAYQFKKVKKGYVEVYTQLEMNDNLDHYVDLYYKDN